MDFSRFVDILKQFNQEEVKVCIFSHKENTMVEYQLSELVGETIEDKLNSTRSIGELAYFITPNREKLFV